MNRRKQITELLKQHEDGLSIPELRRMTKASDSSVRAALRVCESVYIDRWRAQKINRGNASGQVIYWEPVYCLHPVPADAPKPTHRPLEQDLT